MKEATLFTVPLLLSPLALFLGCAGNSHPAPPTGSAAPEVVFVANDRHEGTQLWASGSAVGSTHVIARINSAGDSFSNHTLTTFLGRSKDNRLFKATTDGKHFTLWKTNGTAAGTKPISEIKFKNQDNDIKLGKKGIYFKDEKRLHLIHGQGVIGKYNKATMAPFAPTVGGLIDNMVIKGDKLYFSAKMESTLESSTKISSLSISKIDPKNNEPLFKSTQITSSRATITALSVIANQQQETLLYIANDNLHIYPSVSHPFTKAAAPHWQPKSFTFHRSHAHKKPFALLELEEPQKGWGIYQTYDGKNFQRLLDIGGPTHQIGQARLLRRKQTGGNRLFFMATAKGDKNPSLWVHDNQKGARPLPATFPNGNTIPVLHPGASSPDLPTGGFCPFKGRVYFGAACDTQWFLWVSDGTPEGTHSLCHTRKGSMIPWRPAAFCPTKNYLYFSAQTDPNKPETRQLWRTDGTEEGTQVLTHFTPDGPLGNHLWSIAPLDRSTKNEGSLLETQEEDNEE